MKKFIFVLIFLISNTVWAANNDNNTYSDNKQGIVATMRQSEFTLKLQSNPTTGYSWFLRDYDEDIIAPVKHSYQAPDTHLVGASGYELWTFRVKAAGFLVPRQTVIHMLYTRPWQTTEPGAESLFTVSTNN